MKKDLTQLVEAYQKAAKQEQIAELNHRAAYRKMELALEELQAACPHKSQEEKSSYHGGGYDYVAETRYSIRCVTCHKLLKHWAKTHPGMYG